VHHVFAADHFPAPRPSIVAGAGAGTMHPGMMAEVPCAPTGGGSLLHGWGHQQLQQHQQHQHREAVGGPLSPPAQSGPFAYHAAGLGAGAPVRAAAGPQFGAGGHDAGYGAGSGLAGAAGYGGAGYGSVADQAAWWEAYDALAPPDDGGAAASGGWFGAGVDGDYDMA
jgi:hypothetical protein